MANLTFDEAFGPCFLFTASTQRSQNANDLCAGMNHLRLLQCSSVFFPWTWRYAHFGVSGFLRLSSNWRRGNEILKSQSVAPGKLSNLVCVVALIIFSKWSPTYGTQIKCHRNLCHSLFPVITSTSPRFSAGLATGCSHNGKYIWDHSGCCYSRPLWMFRESHLANIIVRYNQRRQSGVTDDVFSPPAHALSVLLPELLFCQK